MNGKKRKLIIGLVGVCMAFAIFAMEVMTNVTDVQATTKVFDAITNKYKVDTTFTILEIEPDDTSYSVKNPHADGSDSKIEISQHAELGYLLPLTNRMSSWSEGHNGGAVIVSAGAAFGNPDTYADAENYPAIIYQMRTYGLIKPSGLDSQGTSTKIGEYPIFGEYTIFSEYYNNTTSKLYDQTNSFVRGVYSMAAGDYQMREGYKLDESARICAVSVSINEIPVYETVSGNEVLTGTTTEEVEILTPVTDVDMTKLQLPTSATDGIPYITHVEAGTGNLSFTRSEKATTLQEYYGITDLALYYSISQDRKYYNSDWFREYVFGSNQTYKDSTIKYVTKAASKVTTKDIDSANLIYISGTNQAFTRADCDLTDEVMTHMYNKEVFEKKAIMMDYACYSSSLNNNISKLALLLWQESQSAIYTDQKDTGVFDATSQMLVDADALFEDDDAVKMLQDTILSGGNGNFVSGNVYVYNHHMTDFVSSKAMVDALDLFCTGDFNSPYTSAVTTQGFSEVLSYINATNQNSTSGTMPSSVTPAVAVQYILVSDGKGLTTVKNSLRVLEIQPSTVFLYNETRGSEEYGYLANGSAIKENRDNFVENYLSSFYQDKAEYIEFESMSIDEFNGRNEDLIENYDIVYIGTETGINGEKAGRFYSVSAGSRKRTQGTYSMTETTTSYVSNFDDVAMIGNVYYNLGDIMKVDKKLIGYFEEDKGVARYAARDLSKTKLEKLKGYLDADNLILVAYDMMSQVPQGNYMINPSATGSKDNGKNVYDKGRVDNSSNMYELLQYARGYRYNYEDGKYQNYDADSNAYKICENLISVGDIEAGYVKKDDINEYVATEKLSLTVNDKPNEYTYQKLDASEVIDPDKVSYLAENNDGTRDLRFEFVIGSDSTDTSAVPTYKPHLYVDVNNDGKYSKTTEDITDIIISVTATGAEAPRDADNEYILSKDVVYTLTRAVANEYSGLIKWKLDIQSNQYENSHASEEGYTLAENITGEEKVIKILQITKNTGSHLNLQNQLANPNSKFGKYLVNVPGYKVLIKTTTVNEFQDEFVAAYTEKKKDDPNLKVSDYAIEYFNQVEIVAAEEGKNGNSGTKGVYGANMLVLGFADDYPDFTQYDASLAIKSYMESGKPVLLAHDFIMFYTNFNQPKILRNLVGMDKYGMTQNIVEKKREDKSIFQELVNAFPNAGGEKYLHSYVSYTRANDKKVVQTIESVGKTVAYQPGSERQTILPYTQGINNVTLDRYYQSGKRWLAVEGKVKSNGDAGAADYFVDKLNDGQITIYPYILPDQFQVTKTHGQYFQLDLDADDDNDGESDVVVWYTLGDNTKNGFNPWANDAAGPCAADGYYIYNKGNITYTGAGHSSMDNATETEAQLFVNTLFAAFNAGYTKPSIGFFETADINASAVSSISVPYDKNVTNPNSDAAVTDSSILSNTDGQYRYKFVDPNTDPTTATDGTPVFFRLSDTNFVRGTKFMEMQYYMKAEGYKSGAEYTLNDGTKASVEIIAVDGVNVPAVNISDKITTYSVADGKLNKKVENTAKMESGVTYGIYLPLSYLNEKGSFTIMIEAKTTINSTSTSGVTTTTEVPELGYQELTVTKTDLLKLD